jgi:hypothetical protein
MFTWRLSRNSEYTALANSFRFCMLPPYVTKLLLGYDHFTLISWPIISNPSTCMVSSYRWLNLQLSFILSGTAAPAFFHPMHVFLTPISSGSVVICVRSCLAWNRQKLGVKRRSSLVYQDRACTAEAILAEHEVVYWDTRFSGG